MRRTMVSSLEGVKCKYRVNTYVNCLKALGFRAIFGQSESDVSREARRKKYNLSLRKIYKSDSEHSRQGHAALGGTK